MNATPPQPESTPGPTSGGRHRLQGRPPWVLAVILLATFSSSLTLTILAIVQPRIAREFAGWPTEIVAWITLAPMALGALFTPAFGRAADMYGRRRIWLGGMVVMLAGIAGSAVAPSMPVLIAARALTGVGGAAVLPAGLALASASYPPERRVVPISWWTATVAFAPALGILVGGFVTEALSWRWLFVGQVPFAVVALAAGVVILPERRWQATGRFDVRGAVTIGVGVLALILGFNQARALGLWFLAAMLVVAAVAAVVFVRVERRAENPVMPLPILTDRAIALTIGARFLLSFVYLGTFQIIPFLLQDVWGWAVAVTSLALLPRPLAMAVSSPFTPRFTKRFGDAGAAVLGATLILAALGVHLVVRASEPWGVPYWTLLFPALVLLGFGLGITTSSLTTVQQKRTPEALLGTVGGISANVNSIAQTVGIAVMLGIVIMTGGVERAASYDIAFVVGCVLSLAAVLMCLALRRTLRSAGPLDFDTHLHRADAAPVPGD